MNLKPISELKKLLVEAESKVPIGAKYRHYKYPERIYTVTDILIIEETKEVGIVYKEIEGERADIKFMRTDDNFTEEVILDGHKVPRFRKI